MSRNPLRRCCHTRFVIPHSVFRPTSCPFRATFQFPELVYILCWTVSRDTHRVAICAYVSPLIGYILYISWPAISMDLYRRQFAWREQLCVLDVDLTLALYVMFGLCVFNVYLFRPSFLFSSLVNERFHDSMFVKTDIKYRSAWMMKSVWYAKDKRWVC